MLYIYDKGGTTASQMTLQQSAAKDDCTQDGTEVLPTSLRICTWTHLDLSTSRLAASCAGEEIKNGSLNCNLARGRGTGVLALDWGFSY